MTKETVRFYRVPSFTSPDKIKYTVRLLLPSGEWRCNCPFFLFNEKKMKAKGLVPKCNHIRKVKREPYLRAGKRVFKRKKYDK